MPIVEEPGGGQPCREPDGRGSAWLAIQGAFSASSLDLSIMRILLALLLIGPTIAGFATGSIDTLAEETSGTVAAPLVTVPRSETCLSAADLREAVADKRVIAPVAAIRAARQVIPRAEIQRARLCRNDETLVYLLTALRRDGPFVHVMVDATTGQVSGP